MRPDSDSDAPLGGVGETALGAAMMRAGESLRPDRLFDDPYAAAFVAAAPPLFPDMPMISEDPALAELEAAFSADIVMRTRFYDEYLDGACAAGCHQVVLLAAGLDTRAFRLDWPSGTRLFELDLPGVLAFKETVLAREHAQPRCARTTIGVDLRDDWPAALVAAGFDRDAPVAWTAEGLLAYLSNDDAARLLTAVGDLSAAGSRLALEHAEFAADSTLSQAIAVPALAAVTSMWAGGLAEDAAEWLSRHGWRVVTHDRATLAASYRRPVSTISAGGFLTATRLDGSEVRT